MRKYRPFQAWFQKKLQLLLYEHVGKLQQKPQFLCNSSQSFRHADLFDNLVKKQFNSYGEDII